MTLHAHFEVLKEKHKKLKSQVEAELQRPSPDLALLQTLKKQKLLLKEEIARIQGIEARRLDAA